MAKGGGGRNRGAADRDNASTTLLRYKARMAVPFTALAAAWLLLINATTFLAFGIDKRRAERRLGRVPEARLLQLTMLGGGAGAFAAQQMFRHKTRKQPFQTRVRLIVALQAVAVVCAILATSRSLLL